MHLSLKSHPYLDFVNFVFEASNDQESASYYELALQAENDCEPKGDTTMLIILLVILLLLSVGTFPSWPYSRGWGYYPSGGLGLVVLILVVLLLLGRI